MEKLNIIEFICYCCGDLTDNFYKSSLLKQDYTCKKCSVLRGKNNRKKRTDRNDLNARYSYAKCSAKSNDKPFLLTKEQYFTLVIKDCYYCQKPSGGLGIGLDRIDNDKTIGYTINNVLPCCRDCNRMRGDRLTVGEMQVAMQAVIELRKKL